MNRDDGHHSKYASVAQLVEQRIRNAQVVGSSPTTSCINPRLVRGGDLFLSPPKREKSPQQSFPLLRGLNDYQAGTCVRT